MRTSPQRSEPHMQKPFFFVLMISKMFCFFLHFSICISKDPEWSKTYVCDSCEKEIQTLFLKENFKYVKKLSDIFLTNTLAKISQCFYIFFSFRTFCIFFSLKKNILVAERRLSLPPPLPVCEPVLNY